MWLLRSSKHYIINNRGRSQTSEQDKEGLERRRHEPLGESGGMPPEKIGVCPTVYMLYCLITAPFDLSLCKFNCISIQYVLIHELFTLGKVGTECRSSIGRKLAEKDAEFLFLVRKLFPCARLIANS